MQLQSPWIAGHPNWWELCFPYQRSTAQQDHENDEALEPAVLHDAVAGLAQLPAHHPQKLGDIHLAAGAVADAACRERWLVVSDLPLGSFLLSPAEKPPC